MLQDNGATGNAITVADVFDAQFHQIAGPELAVQTQIKQYKLSRPVADLQPNPDGPDVLELQGRLLANDFSFVPGNFGWGFENRFHNALLKVEGENDCEPVVQIVNMIKLSGCPKANIRHHLHIGGIDRNRLTVHGFCRLSHNHGMSSIKSYLHETEVPTRADADALMGLTLLEFGTEWCGHCRAAQPALADALLQHPQLRHLKIEDGPGRPLGRSYRVKLWPTLVLLRDGLEVARMVRPTQAADISTVLNIA